MEATRALSFNPKRSVTGRRCSSFPRDNIVTLIFLTVYFFLAEHDACIKEISELKWQLKLDREKLDQAREKLSYAEAWNRSLREDIDFAKKQMPVVKANLELQRGIINQINAAQAEVNSNVLHSCVCRQSTTHTKSSKEGTFSDLILPHTHSLFLTHPLAPF